MEKLRSPGFLRALTWVSALVLLAGVAAFVTVKIAGSDDNTPSVSPGEITDELPVTTAPDVSEVPEAARLAAVKFITGAVARNDLAGAWEVTHPTIKRDCDCTLAEWKTGDIPVLFFPSLGGDTIRFGVNEITDDGVVLEVLLTPKAGTDLTATAFYVGLKKVGSGDSEKWLVDYFAPIGSPPVPASE